MTVPRLNTALAGPLPDLERQLLASQPDIERWLRGQWQDHAAPFYCSVDLRNSSFKLAPVDTNLFPGGFNNLNPDFHPLCVQAAMAAFEKSLSRRPGHGAGAREPHAQPVLSPERRGAADHIAARGHGGAHRQPACATSPRPRRSRSRTERSSCWSRSSAAATASRWTASIRAWCCSTTISPPERPRSCSNLEQSVLPPLHAGWTVRRKSNHFQAYREVAEEFAKLLGIDPWLINPYFEKCGRINFQEKQGEECLEGYVTEILEDIRGEVPGVRHQAGAVRHRQGRRGHLRHGDHDREGSVRGARPEPQPEKEDGGGEGRPGGARSHGPGRGLFLRDRGRCRRRAGRLHDRSLRRGRLLPGAYRPRHGREPERAGHAVPAARVRRALLFSQSGRSRLPAEPLLRLRRHRPARPARGGHRARADRRRIRRRSPFECRLNGTALDTLHGDPHPRGRWKPARLAPGID